MEIIRKEETASDAKEVVFMLDTEVNLSQLNHAWTILTGYPISESLRKPLILFVESTEDIQHIKAFILNAELDELRIELQVKTATITKPVEAYFCKVYDSNSCASIFGIFVDITKSAESRRGLLQQITFEHQIKKEFNDHLNIFSHELSSAQAALFSSVELLEMINPLTIQATEKKSSHYTNIKAQIQNINILLEDFLSTWRTLYLKEDKKQNMEET